MEDGIILIDKPAGMTSFGVVARIRRVLSEGEGKRAARATDSLRARSDEGKPLAVPHKRKRVKVGHTGTLDPFATGLMILTIGKECKNAGMYTKLDKVYEATFRLGQTSSTGDPEGALTEVSAIEPARETLEKVLEQFTGEISQKPPIFSAIKINGQRAYHLARNGQEVEIPTRRITIHSLELIDYSYPEVKIRTHVSSGTYIRSLAVDIGEALGTGAYCGQLRRTKIADFSVENAKKLEDFGITD